MSAVALGARQKEWNVERFLRAKCVEARLVLGCGMWDVRSAPGIGALLVVTCQLINSNRVVLLPCRTDEFVKQPSRTRLARLVDLTIVASTAVLGAKTKKGPRCGPFRSGLFSFKDRMGRAGLEQTQFPAGKTDGDGKSGAESGAVANESGPNGTVTASGGKGSAAPDRPTPETGLARVVESWAELPAAIRAGIVAMVDATKPRPASERAGFTSIGRDTPK